MATVDIRNRFDSIISQPDEELASIIRSAGIIASDEVLELVRQTSTGTVSQLVEQTEKLSTDIRLSNQMFQCEIILGDESLASSVQMIESSLLRGAKNLRGRINDFEIRPKSVSQLDNFREQKQRIRFLMTHAQSIIDVLEIPQLVDNCVSCDNFAEAVSLLDFISRISKKVKLFDSLPTLEQQVKQARETLVRELERGLSGRNLKLQETNNLLLVYGMMHPKEDLKRKFVGFRSTNYIERRKQIEIAKNSVDPPAKRIKDYTELVRVQLTEILTQFKLLFQVDELDPDLLKFSLDELTTFLEFLRSTLDKLPPDNIFSVIAEVYQHISLIKVFQLNPFVGYIFHSFALTKAEKHLTETLSFFKVELSQYNWRPSLTFISNGLDSNSITQLTRHRPLAILYNDITNLLNDLRAFPLLSSRDGIQNSIENILTIALDLVMAVKNTTHEVEIARKHFCHILVPYLEKYFGSVFGFKPDFRIVKKHPQFLPENLNRSENVELD
jgi:hypothetical protein